MNLYIVRIIKNGRTTDFITVPAWTNAEAIKIVQSSHPNERVVCNRTYDNEDKNKFLARS